MATSILLVERLMMAASRPQAGSLWLRREAGNDGAGGAAGGVVVGENSDFAYEIGVKVLDDQVVRLGGVALFNRCDGRRTASAVEPIAGLEKLGHLPAGAVLPERVALRR